MKWSRSPRLTLRVMIGLGMLIALAGNPPARGASATLTGKRALVRRSAEVESLLASRTLHILEEYAGGLLLVEGSAVTLDGALALPGGLSEARGIDDTIHLTAREIDTSIPSLMAPPPGAGGGLELIQFHGPPRPEWLLQLASAGLHVISAIPYNAYLVWADDPGQMAAMTLPIRWRQPFATGDRLSPGLSSTAATLTVTIEMARAGSWESAMARIGGIAGGFITAPASLGQVIHLRATIPAAAITEILEIPEVIWIEPFDLPVSHDERSAIISAGMVFQGAPGPPGYLAWLESRGLSDLSSQIVDVTDTGIGRGDPAMAHPGLTGRVAYSVNATQENLLEDCAGHGTNIAGIIAGGATAGSLLVDSDGYLPGLGVAPTSRVGATRIFLCNGLFDPNQSFPDLVWGAFTRGARVGNNSWGGSGPQYNTITMEYDALVRDANGDPSDGDQAFLPIFSTGNRGPDPLTLGWPASAKNVLSVGATEGYRPFVLDGCGTSGQHADHADFMLLISSRGPTGDGRLKPDIVAPGSHVQSLASDAPLYSGIGVCDKWYPQGQRLLNWSTGTSQAAAHASGAAAIAAEVYQRRFGRNPSPAMLKAVLINHARDLGNELGFSSNTNHRPSINQGWGRVDVGAVVDARARAASDQEYVLTATGESVPFDSITADDPNQPVIITLVWTDPPGSPAGWAFVNDLDLVVEASGSTYHGNVMYRGASVPGGVRDGRNNVEQVVLPVGALGLDIRVEASSLAGDGIPSLPGVTDQDFALYISNAHWPRSAGKLSINAPAADCGRPLPFTISAQSGRGLGRLSATVESGADHETVILSEDPPGFGLFRGAVDVALGTAIPGNGALEITNGSGVTATYLEVDPVTGTPVPRTAQTIARCAAPILSDVRVARSGDTSATITWTTDRPSDSSVAYGPGASRTFLATNAATVLHHSVRIIGLSPCTFYTATAASVDSTGQRTEGPSQPLPFSTGKPGQRRTLYFDDMEALSSRWRHIAMAGTSPAVDEWELGFPPSTLVPASGFSGRHVWGTHLDGDYSLGGDMALISEAIDLSDAVSPHLTFQHFYAIYGGQSPSSFNDGGWVEVTSDGGESWTLVEPTSGYPDTVDLDIPWLPVNSKAYAGFPAAWTRATFDLSAWAGRVVQIRFRFWQDAAAGTPRAAGWYLDDVKVTAEGLCNEGRIALDAEEYGCTSRLHVILNDEDLDSDPAAPGQTTAVLRSGVNEMEVVLTETGPSTGEFEGTASLGFTGGIGVLGVSQGESVTVAYDDLDAGGGLRTTVTDSALVTDCVPPPAPVFVSAEPDGAGNLTVQWSTVDTAHAPDLQGYRLHYDSDSSGPIYAGGGAAQGTSPIRAEAATTTRSITPVAGCTPYFVTVTAFDRLGNESAFAPEAFGVAGGSLCTTGRLTASPEDPGCGETVAITVLDLNADPNSFAIGAIPVQAEGPSHQGSLIVTLTETTTFSGIFTGTLAISPVALPGTLTVNEGDTLTLRYTDASDGMGGTRLVTRPLRVSDCTPPAITNLRLDTRRSDGLVVRWATDEPATSRVDHGPDTQILLSIEDTSLTTFHAIDVSGLTACSPFHYVVQSRDARGNVGTAGVPLPLADETFSDHVIFTDDLESGAPGWSSQGMAGTVNEWELGTPNPAVADGPPAAWSGLTLWGTDLDGPYDLSADMVLITPEVSLPSALASSLVFRHWYSISTDPFPPLGNGSDDGAFLEISVDGGPWQYLPHGDDPVHCITADPSCYDDRIANNPYTPALAGGWAGFSGGWVKAIFPLDAWAGHRVRIRFHLYKDRDCVGMLCLPRAGWYLDDVTFLYGAACHRGQILLDRDAYICGGDTVLVTVLDGDLNLNPQTPDTTPVLVASNAEPAGEGLTLIETGANTAIFEGTLPIAPLDSAGTLLVATGDIIEARYEDDDSGAGSPRTARAQAIVPDCTGPVISSVSAPPPRSGSVVIQWNTSEPADSHLLYGPTPAFGSSIIIPGLRTAHAVTLSSLASCARVSYTVASTDADGNFTRDDSISGFRTLESLDNTPLHEEGFGGAAQGWTHSGPGDSWIIAGGMASTSPGGPYTRDPGGGNANFALTSPSISIHNVTAPHLTLEHSYSFATSFQGDDGAWVEGWDGYRWVTLTPDGGYPGTLDPESGGTGSQRPGFTGVASGFITSRFDLSALTGAPGGFVRVRLRVFIEGGIGPVGTGWDVENLSVRGEVPCQAGHLAFQRSRATCALGAAPLFLHDRGLDLDPVVEDQALVEVTSTGGPVPLMIVLTETSPSSGAFMGTVPLNPLGVIGTLRAAEGDLLTATYQDQDDGSGNSRTISSSLPVAACGGPAIRDVVVAPIPGNAVSVSWVTDRPATSEVSLFSTGGTGSPFRFATDPSMMTSHRLTLRGLAPCASYTVGIASTDADDVRTALAASTPGLTVAVTDGLSLFSDSMEGTDPGWTIAGPTFEWQRGVPTVGPDGAFSGSRVWATDLTGKYDPRADETLTSPPIDLQGRTGAKLTFWHWYDIFASDPPNSQDDAAWVEVVDTAGGAPVYIEPIGGYPDTTDQELGRPLREGTPVYSGQSKDWERAEFDLTPFVGRVIRLRFLLWNDFVEFTITGQTGAGWYVDDIEITSSAFCHPAPAITPIPLSSMTPGSSSGTMTLDGSGFLDGFTVAAGAGMTAANLAILSPNRITFVLSAAAGAPLGPRNLIVRNPDGQTATLQTALEIRFDPSRADLNGTRRVDTADLLALARAFGTSEGDAGWSATADLNGDGYVDGRDLALLAAQFGRSF